jgi:hypothetical protein
MGDYPPEALREIVAVLVGIEANPRANRQDMEELDAAYRRWRVVLRRDNLVNDNDTMHTFPTLSSFGRLFLLKHRRVASEGNPAGTASAQQPLPPARHSLDFCSVHWYGTDYTFSLSQASIVKILWEAWDNGTPAVHQQTLLDRVGSSMADNSKPRLRDLFRDHPAWTTMIRPGSAKGTFCLVAPEEYRLPTISPTSIPFVPLA